MRLRLLVASCLLVLAASIVSPSTATECTEREIAAFTDANATVAPHCVTVLRDFGTCADDSCLAALSAVVPSAPTCTVAPSDTTLLQSATALVAQCEAARAAFNASSAYAPTLAARDAPACSATQETDWQRKYGPEYLFGACALEALENQKCTSECRTKIEEGVRNAPRCRESDGDLFFGEAAKVHLVRCLKVRGEPLDANGVLQAVISAAAESTASGSRETATATTTTPPQLPVVATKTTSPPVSKPVNAAAATPRSVSILFMALVVAVATTLV